MVSKEEVRELVRVSLIGPILRYAEASLPEGQFRAYRKLVLDQFGEKGFGRELDKLFLNKGQRDGQGSGGPIPRRKDGAL